jgi:hypothetical protein
MEVENTYHFANCRLDNGRCGSDNSIVVCRPIPSIAHGYLLSFYSGTHLTNEGAAGRMG